MKNHICGLPFDRRAFLVLLILAVFSHSSCLDTTLAEFPDVQLPLLHPKGNQQSLDLKHDKYVAAIFSPTDCGTCLSILNHLNRLHQTNANQVDIIGIIDTAYPQAAFKFQRVYNLQFPILYDSLGVVKKSLKLDIKPALILLDSGTIKKKAIVGVSQEQNVVNEIMSILEKNEFR